MKFVKRDFAFAEPCYEVIGSNPKFTSLANLNLVSFVLDANLGFENLIALGRNGSNLTSGIGLAIKGQDLLLPFSSFI